ncbi:Protein kinase superfamily protein [Klebsormidium nitens]|uniref:non-specific serine/threonine protein kinase n=1 Tax=Klebsormidium nitens TaxID=105231 RepID=A0A1Y1IBC7_KLENI|nr:Protein kinase superfamily protein [Klebsormidium nitens]|eukprot:GAQ86017.1 Protein kinase superfamily protein [Klebsormidium nitens]
MKNNPGTDEESGRANHDKDGSIKDLYGDDTREPPPQQKQKRPKQTSAPPSGDAFAWPEMTNSQSGVGQQRSGSHFSSGRNSTSFASGGTQGTASAPPAPTPAPYGVMVLSIAEVVQSTENFSTKNFLGQGGFSNVYRGILSDGRTVAVKRLHFHSLTGGQETAAGERDFQAEASIIARVHHRHLVQLVGFCTNAQERILVLEYMKNGSLADNLYGIRAASVISWPQRLIIAIGAAKGLAYLHEDCQPRIVHRDIKASNILLDSNLGAKISDFGFARFAREFQSTATATRTVGTFQYLPPECTMYGEKNTDKSDVYSFGVVLLELLAGRPPVDPGQPRERVALIVWVRTSGVFWAFKLDVLEVLLWFLVEI